MYLPNDQSKIFCLEALADSRLEHQSSTLPYLEKLALQQGMTSVYKSCECIDSFEASLEVLLYDDHQFDDYELLYFIFEGTADSIVLDRYTFSLQEIAERFEGKLDHKIIHFSNRKALELDSESLQFFLDVTHAQAISGYSHTHAIKSTPLDMNFFSLYDPELDVRNWVETLFKKNYASCTQLGFHLYY